MLNVGYIARGASRTAAWAAGEPPLIRIPVSLSICFSIRRRHLGAEPEVEERHPISREVFPDRAGLVVILRQHVALEPLTLRRPGAGLTGRALISERAFTSTHSLG